jgi:alkylhydroperoxidase family enzyme
MTATNSPYRIHTIDSAPETSKATLSALKQAFGLIPNTAAVMADSPALLNGFVGLVSTLRGGTFTQAQREVLLLTNAVTNRATWPVAFHSTLALKEGVDPQEVRAIREGRLPGDHKLRALSALTRALIEKRGRADDADLAAFAEAGFTRDQSLEVVACIAVSTMANYTASIGRPPVEEPFKAQSWTA